MTSSTHFTGTLSNNLHRDDVAEYYFTRTLGQMSTNPVKPRDDVAEYTFPTNPRQATYVHWNQV
jgi:hypothetical protein